MNKQKNRYLILAIFIPLMMIIVVALNLIFNRVNLHPQYNFIYMINESYPYTCWQVMQSKIFSDPKLAPKTSVDCSKTKLYEYDFTNNKSTLIALQDAKKMKLSSPKNTTSPDGFIINSYCNPSDIFSWVFPVYSNNFICLRKDDVKQRLEINSYYFYFLGWKLAPSKG